MKKFLNWIVGAFLFLTAIFFASKARSLNQRSQSKTEKEINELVKTKDRNLARAQKLGEQAETKFQKAHAAKGKAEKLAQELEKKDATSLANRVRDFNERL